MGLSLQLHDALKEIYIKKYKMIVCDTDVSIVFERDFDYLDGKVEVIVGEFALPALIFPFSSAKDVIESNTLIEHLNSSLHKTGQSQSLIDAIKTLLPELMKADGSYAPETNSVATVCDVERKLQKILKGNVPGFSGDEIAFHPTLNFMSELDVEEIHFVEMIMAVEMEFNIEIEDDDLEDNIRDVTYGCLLDVVKKRLKD